MKRRGRWKGSWKDVEPPQILLIHHGSVVDNGTHLGVVGMTPGLQLATGLGGISLQHGEVQGGFVDEAATGLTTSKVLVGVLRHF